MSVKLLKVLLSVVSSCLLAAAAQAQSYPARAIQLLVGFSAGSGTDLVARKLAEGLGKRLGQPVVVVNVPGAGSTLAAARAAKAAPDGYTLYLADFSHAIAPALYPSLPYDTVGDFKAVAPISRFEFVLAASGQSGFRSVGDLVAAATRRPGQVSFGSSGNGTALHLMGEVFASKVQSKFLHVPFKGGGDVLNALLSGSVDFALFPLPPLMGLAAEGKLRILAVPGQQRDERMKEVPTMAEQGIADFDPFTWNLLLVPARTDEVIVQRLAEVAREVASSREFQEGISSQGAKTIASMSPQATQKYLENEVARWGAVVRASGAKNE